MDAGAQETLDMGGRGRDIDRLVRFEVGGDGWVHALPLRHGLPFFPLVARLGRTLPSQTLWVNRFASRSAGLGWRKAAPYNPARMNRSAMPPRDFLRRLFEAALAAADPARCVPPHLPAVPKGRTIVVGAGKAAAKMARA
ncbi:MAG: DUF4147 domain-containing protein, partial [Dongiaceae bacterium]